MNDWLETLVLHFARNTKQWGCHAIDDCRSIQLRMPFVDTYSRSVTPPKQKVVSLDFSLFNPYVPFHVSAKFAPHECMHYGHIAPVRMIGTLNLWTREAAVKKCDDYNMHHRKIYYPIIQVRNINSERGIGSLRMLHSNRNHFTF